MKTTIMFVCACAMMLVGCAGGDSHSPPMKDPLPPLHTPDANVPDVGVIPPQDCPDCVQDAMSDVVPDDTNAMNWNYDCLVPGVGAIKCKTEDGGGTSFTWSDTANNNVERTCEACPVGVECRASDSDGGTLIGHCGAN